MQIKTKGLVLQATPFGESDKRLVVLTKEAGKITVFAKGARKSKSRFLALSQMFSYCDYVLYKGKSSYNISSGELIESFHHLSRDVDSLTYGVFVLEFAEYVSNENDLNHPFMQLVLRTLKVLEQASISPDLVIHIFQLKALTYLGYTPWVMDCVLCNKEEAVYFSPKEGGLLCSDHMGHDKESILLNEGALHAMQYIVGSELKQLYQFELDSHTEAILKKVVVKYVKFHFNKSFKSLELLI